MLHVCYTVFKCYTCVLHSVKVLHMCVTQVTDHALAIILWSCNAAISKDFSSSLYLYLYSCWSFNAHDHRLFPTKDLCLVVLICVFVLFRDVIANSAMRGGQERLVGLSGVFVSYLFSIYILFVFYLYLFLHLHFYLHFCAWQSTTSCCSSATILAVNKMT